MNDRALDVVVYGATGFTGELVAEYLHEHHGDSGLRWAIAGRSEPKLAGVRERLQARHDAPLPELIVADSSDPDSLRAMCARTTVVITTVGPYARYGEPLVEAAIAEGTHTVDLTGEPQYIRRLIDRQHEAAQKAGVRIVNCCGFDSIPSDLGCLVLQQTAIARHGEPCPEVESIVWAASGGYSGGTAASMMELMDEASADPEIRRILADPYSLDPGGEGTSHTHELRAPRHSEWAQGTVAPWFMAAVNERVVRRTNGLLGYPWGRDLSYQEVLRTGSGLGGRLKGWGLAAGMGVGMVAMAVGPVRRLAGRFLLAPGEGPSREERDAGFLRMEQFGRAGGKPGQEVQVTIRASKDPGYGATAIMLGESGLCLALQGEQLERTGVLTPASAMGSVLVERLNAAGVTFTPAEPTA